MSSIKHENIKPQWRHQTKLLAPEQEEVIITYIVLLAWCKKGSLNYKVGYRYNPDRCNPDKFLDFAIL